MKMEEDHKKQLHTLEVSNISYVMPCYAVLCSLLQLHVQVKMEDHKQELQTLRVNKASYYHSSLGTMSL